MLLSVFAPLVRSATFGEPNKAPQWKFSIPSEVAGPIDKTLPASWQVDYARLCLGDHGRVGVVWLRDAEFSHIPRRVAVRESQPTATEDVVEPSHAPKVASESGGRRARKLDTDRRDAELVGMCVLGPNGVEGSALLEGLEPRSVVRRSVRQPTYYDDKWHVTMTLWPSSSIHPATHGVAIATFDASGWSKPDIVLPEVMEPVWAFHAEGHTDLLWYEYYWPRSSSARDDGDALQRLRFRYAQLTDGQRTETRTVFDGADDPTISEDRWQLVRWGEGQCDLIFTRHSWPPGTPWPEFCDVMHAPDILGSHPKAYKFAQRRFNSTLAVVPLSKRRLQVVWLEEKSLRRQQGRRPFTVCLLEVTFDGKSWRAPRLLYEHSDWDYRSLAVTSFRSGDQEGVFALWRDEDGFLTWTVGSESREWSGPVTTKLAIGRENWVLSHERGFTLVTKMDRNLYWCHFTLRRDPATTQPP